MSREIPWNTDESPVRVSRNGETRLYVSFGDAAASQPEQFLIRDEIGRVVGIRDDGGSDQTEDPQQHGEQNQSD